MCNFRVGQKVVCIENDESSPPGYVLLSKVASPEVGKVYTIRGIQLGIATGRTCLLFHEIPDQTVDVLVDGVLYEGGLCFAAAHFRPVVERKTDISLFKAMLHTNNQTEDA